MYSTRFDISKSVTSSEAPNKNVEAGTKQTGAISKESTNSSNNIVTQIVSEKGYQKVVEVLHMSKVFVLNSKYEATSYALIEAKMCGLPVIAKLNYGNSTVIRNNIDGFIVHQNSREDLKYLIKKLISDDHLRISFGAEARRDALIRFDQESNFLKIFSTLKA